MNRMNRWIVMAGMAAALGLGTNAALAQQDNQGRPGRGNFDPAQFRERMMERYKEQLEITDNAEWNAIQPLIEKVMQARMATFSGMGRGMMGGMGGPPRRGGDNAPDGGQSQRRGGFGQPNPEAEALQKAVDAKAPKAEIKSALEKYHASRKAKQTELEKAQDDLRKVLTTRQEAILTLNGML